MTGRVEVANQSEILLFSLNLISRNGRYDKTKVTSIGDIKIVPKIMTNKTLGLALHMYL